MILRKLSSLVQIKDRQIIIFMKVANVLITWKRYLCLPGIQMMHCVVMNLMEFALMKILRHVVLLVSSSVSLMLHVRIYSIIHVEQDVVMDQNHSQIDSGAQNASCYSSIENVNSATDQNSESCNPCSSISYPSKPSKWTRYIYISLGIGPFVFTTATNTRKQDKVILQMCLKSQGDESNLNKTIAEIASSMDCDIRDVSRIILLIMHMYVHTKLKLLSQINFV